MRNFLTVLLVALFIAVACSSQPVSSPNASNPTPEPPSSNTTIIETPTSAPTPSDEPTATPSAAPTQTPTSTPIPTPTFSPGRVILPTVAIPTATLTAIPEDPLSAKFDEIGVRTAVLRELFALEKVDRNMISRDELEEYLVESLEEDREDISNSQKLYKTLGILEQDDDLYDILLNLFGGSVLGFFDTEKEELYVVRDSEELTATDTLTYAHEYAHSLQQQHFDIYSTREGIKENGDTARAFQALIEGDATLAQTIYMFNNLDESEQREVLEQAQSDGSQEAFNETPYFIQRELTFPYSEGVLFAFALFQSANNDWDVVNDAFSEIPQSTEQIIHPEKYLSKEEPIEVSLPDISGSLGDGWEQTDKDTFGEFFLRTYLESELPADEASPAADGWGGDTYALLSGPEDVSVVVSKITWDSEDDAQEFFDTFVTFMETQAGGEWQAEDGDEATRLMVTSGQSVLLSIDALDTLVIFAPDSDTLEASQLALQ